MSPRELLRLLAPAGWLLVVAVALAAGVVILGSLGWRWDPFERSARRADRAEARAEAAESQAVARALEVEGEVALRRSSATRAAAASAAHAATAVTLNEARIADDASTPLDPVRADRLRRHDDELCRLAPDLEGCAAAPDAG
ncbi:hypothetical protein ASG17_06480 [Brevundimonas sp. Leaf363]|uniref:hypothetical protein n=1 Tax=Brevundimonas sp. Leaf363 TaxID=1736353 RepID=UPI0006F52942|nr:hypothetical protein [Brevundimonas sp. Leaf363]KQS55707.1 hypothetical protein ASG17_06480 [Brevundimonas sp. Leaf363]